MINKFKFLDYKLPTWIPKTPRPFFQLHREVYDKMNDNDRRWSFLFDLTVISIVIIFVLISI